VTRGTWSVVGHSYGAFTAPLVADRLRADALVLLAGMIPSPGEALADWSSNTGHEQAVQERIEGGHCVALSRPKVLADLLVGYV
jgi:hypothetical protein